MMTKKFSKTFSLFMLIGMGLFITSCEDCEDSSISELQLCVEVPSGDRLCDENKTSFAPFDPSITASCKVNCVETTDNVTYTLYFNNGGNLIQVSEKTISISDAGEEADSYETFATLPLPDNTMWNVGEWQVDVEVDSAVPVRATKTFNVVE